MAARRSWAARGLSSGRFAVVAPCFCTVWGGMIKTPINWSEECSRGSVVPHLYSDIVGNWKPSGSSEKAEKRSNCHMAYQYRNEFEGTGRNREMLHEIIVK